MIRHQKNILLTIILKKRKKGDFVFMTNELIEKLIGKVCTITTGSFGTAVVGKVISVTDNWIEIETKKRSQLINADFVVGITHK